MKNCAILLLSYGGPEHQDDVVPFIENVLAEKQISLERIKRIAAKYQVFGGVSPLNEECRQLIVSITQQMDHTSRGETRLPVYWGNLFWHPLLQDTILTMAAENITHMVVFCTVPFASPQSFFKYSGALDAAINKVKPASFQVKMIPPFGKHPLFIQTVVEQISKWISHLKARDGSFQKKITILFSAHSLPFSDDIDAIYRDDLIFVSNAIVSSLAEPMDWELVFQSRGGGPSEAWIGPDISEFKFLPNTILLVVPIGFMFENIELLYDLDYEFARTCAEKNTEYIRVPAVGRCQKIMEMINVLIETELNSFRKC